MTFVCKASQAGDHPSRIALPIRRIQPRERRNEVDVSIVSNCSRQRLDVAAFFNKSEVIAKPLDECSGISDATFQSIMHRLVAKFVSHRGEQSKLGMNGLRPGILQHATTRTVSVLCFTGVETGLANKRRLLIAQNSGDSNILDRVGSRLSVYFAARYDFGEHFFRNAIDLQHLRVPVKSLQVHELGAARVGYIREVDSALCAAPRVPEDKQDARSKQT